MFGVVMSLRRYNLMSQMGVSNGAQFLFARVRDFLF
jgi:hypothetical protein